MIKEYFILSDESVKKGKYYSNFYGGLIVEGVNYENLTNYFMSQKELLRINGEMKWEKVNPLILDSYKEIISLFFQKIYEKNIRIRIMFRQNLHQYNKQTENISELEYFKLYYQFLKHSFGLKHIPVEKNKIRLRLYLDMLPDTREKVEQFKGFILGLNKINPHLEISKDNITEIKSEQHVLLQCLDILLGSIQFRLNNLHKAIPEGKKRRGKRTIAKENLYKHINKEIRLIKKNFNIGVSTKVSEREEYWYAPYLHWSFKPYDSSPDEKFLKKRKRKGSVDST